MSRRAPSSMLAVLLVSLSSVTGCSTGFVPTLWQMSLMRCALNIPDLIVADRWKATIGTAQCMFDVKSLSHTHRDGSSRGHHP